MLMFYKHISMFNYFFWRWSLHFFFQKKVGNKNDTGYWYTVTSVTKFIRFLCCILIWYIILNILTLTHSKTFQKAGRNTFKLPIINSTTNRNGKFFVQKSNADKYKFINLLWIVLYFTLEGFVFYLHLFLCMLFSGFHSNVPFNLFWLVRRLCFIFLNLCLQTEKKSFIKSKVNLYYALVLSYKNTNYSYLTMQWQQIGLANITHI